MSRSETQDVYRNFAPEERRTSNPDIHITTFKLAPQIGAGLRIKAALEKVSVAEVAELAIKEALKRHGRKTKDLPPKVRSGRPGPSVEAAARSILSHRATRNDAIPTRMEADTARELEELCRSLGTRMKDLAEEGALELLRRDGPEIAMQVAGLEGETGQQTARDKLQEVADGLIAPDDLLKAPPKKRARKSDAVEAPQAQAKKPAAKKSAAKKPVAKKSAAVKAPVAKAPTKKPAIAPAPAKTATAKTKKALKAPAKKSVAKPAVTEDARSAASSAESGRRTASKTGRSSTKRKSVKQGANV